MKTHTDTTSTGIVRTSNISSGVVSIFSTGSAFAALKSDGSVVTWGDSTSGGDSGAVAEKLKWGGLD